MDKKMENLDFAFQIIGNTKDRVENQAPDSVMPAGFTIPQLDLSKDTHRQVTVDRQEDVYLGHVTTCLLDDNKTILAVYPKGHAVGQWVLKKSTDGGLTWSDRLPVPFGWGTMCAVPTIYKMYDKQGKRRIMVFGGGFPIRCTVSEDDGETWRDMAPIGNYGGLDVFTSMVETAPGEYIAFFNDNGVFFSGDNRLMQIWHTGEGYDARSKAIWTHRKADGSWHHPPSRYGCKPVLERPDDKWELVHAFTLGNPNPDKCLDIYAVKTTDGGLTWGKPQCIVHSARQLMEAAAVKSPDGKQILVMLRCETRTYNSHCIISNDGGKTWSEPVEMPAAVTGDRHAIKYLNDGRIFMSFRDMALRTETKGDWMGWIGTYDDLVNRREGQYRIRLMENNECDCAYAGVEVLPDGTVVATSYGEFDAGKPNYIVSVRFHPDETDEMFKKIAQP